MLVERVQSEVALAKTPGLVLVAPEGRAAEQGGWEVGGGGQSVGPQRLSWARAAPRPLCPGEPRALPCLLSRGRGSHPAAAASLCCLFSARRDAINISHPDCFLACFAFPYLKFHLHIHGPFK